MPPGQARRPWGAVSDRRDKRKNSVSERHDARIRSQEARGHVRRRSGNDTIQQCVCFNPFVRKVNRANLDRGAACHYLLHQSLRAHSTRLLRRGGGDRWVLQGGSPAGPHSRIRVSAPCCMDCMDSTMLINWVCGSPEARIVTRFGVSSAWAAPASPVAAAHERSVFSSGVPLF